MENPKAHVAEYKKGIVEKFAKLMVDYPIIGIINMENMPCAQLQKMRKQLRGKAEMAMTKNRLINLAIEKAKEKKKDIVKLREHITGMPALLFTRENPFSISRIIKKSKSKAPAKPGQSAPDDITVSAGPTPFTPGPVISEFGALGIKTKVEEGKINIVSDTVVAKKGDMISPGLSSMLLKLGIEPMEIGLDLVAAYEDGVVYTKDVLDVDEEKFIASLVDAARWALNLSVEAAYMTEENSDMIIGKAFREAKGVAIEACIYADDVMGDVLAKAERQMIGLAADAGIDLEKKEPEAAKETPAEKPEEVKAEPAAEKDAPAKPAAEEAKKEEPKTTEEKPEEAKEQPAGTQEEKEAPAKEDKEIPAEKGEGDKIKKMVEATKNFAKGGAETAEKIVEGVLKGDGSRKEEKKEADDEMKKVEGLVKELQKKGTLRQ